MLRTKKNEEEKEETTGGTNQIDFYLLFEHPVSIMNNSVNMMKNLLFGIVLTCSLSSAAQTMDTLKNETKPVIVNTDSVYTKVDVEAQFPGGEKKWNKFIQDIIASNIDLLVNDTRSNGICTVKFIVDKDGKISAARVMSMEGSELAKIFLNAVLKGPNWIPATINGINVKSIRYQKVTFQTR